MDEKVKKAKEEAKEEPKEVKAEDPKEEKEAEDKEDKDENKKENDNNFDPTPGEPEAEDDFPQNDYNEDDDQMQMVSENNGITNSMQNQAYQNDLNMNGNIYDERMSSRNMFGNENNYFHNNMNNYNNQVNNYNNQMNSQINNQMNNQMNQMQNANNQNDEDNLAFNSQYQQEIKEEEEENNENDMNMDNLNMKNQNKKASQQPNKGGFSNIQGNNQEMNKPFNNQQMNSNMNMNASNLNQPMNPINTGNKVAPNVNKNFANKLKAKINRANKTANMVQNPQGAQIMNKNKSVVVQNNQNQEDLFGNDEDNMKDKENINLRGKPSNIDRIKDSKNVEEDKIIRLCVSEERVVTAADIECDADYPEKRSVVRLAHTCFKA